MNRRELFAALAATAVAGDALALAGQSPNTAPKTAPVMGSKVFDWNSIAEKPTPYGTVRSFCSAPTATLENLELHVTTLNPGMSPHAPHKHPNEELIIIRQGKVETLSNGEWIRVGAGIGDFQRVEPTPRVQERGNGAGDLSRGEREDRSDAGGVEAASQQVGEPASQR